VYLNLQHYTGPRTYAANGERAKGSENIVAGLSLGVKYTAEAFGPVGGTVVIVKADKTAGGLGVGAMVTGAIDADVQDKSAGVGGVKDPVHISGTFSTSLIRSSSFPSQSVADLHAGAAASETATADPFVELDSRSTWNIQRRML
jgi:hypothetical protein